MLSWSTHTFLFKHLVLQVFGSTSGCFERKQVAAYVLNTLLCVFAHHGSKLAHDCVRQAHEAGRTELLRRTSHRRPGRRSETVQSEARGLNHFRPSMTIAILFRIV